MSRVRAAGGVVIRRGPAGEAEVLVVHRPRYDDWSFPKGKLDAAEGYEEAALREVAEETGIRCRLRREIGSISYIDPRGRPKLVKYYLMHPIGGDIEDYVPNPEIDDVRWVPLSRAAGLLTYGYDRELLGGLGG